MISINDRLGFKFFRESIEAQIKLEQLNEYLNKERSRIYSCIWQKLRFNYIFKLFFFMKIGLQVPNFTFQGGKNTFAEDIKEISIQADKAGFDSLWVSQHPVRTSIFNREPLARFTLPSFYL